MTRTMVGLTILFLLSCSSGGTNVSGLDFGIADDTGKTGSDAIAGLDLIDGSTPNDNTVLPPADQAGQPETEDAVQVEDIADGLLPPDVPGEDSSQPPADIGEYFPFAGCSKTEPCPFPEEPLCLMLPDSDQGICVKQCAEDGDQCPPWLDCIPPDPEDPAFAVCLRLKQMYETCDNKEGELCDNGLFCVDPPGQISGLCTAFCTAGETVCPVGTTCTVLYEEQPDWGACLPMPELPVCTVPGACEGFNTACATLAEDFSVCASECAQEGAACEEFGTCLNMPDPDGNATQVCLLLQGEGGICDIATGMICDDGLVCADVAAQNGAKHCFAPCADEGACSGGQVCAEPTAPAGATLCIPFEFAYAKPTKCNDDYPCEEEGKVCVIPPSKPDGYCVPSCDGGCADGLTCLKGGCVVVAEDESNCLEDNGVLCLPPSVCAKDHGEDGQGWCAHTCAPGQDGQCEGETECLQVGDGQSYCMTAAGFGEKCSVDDGVACSNDEDLLCLHMASNADFGYCAYECEGPGTCPPLEGTTSECIAQKGGKWYCGFLCGGSPSCPGNMDCSGFGMCMP